MVSKLVFSKQFSNVLGKIDSDISRLLSDNGNLKKLSISNFNYIGLTDQNDLISFTPKSKIEEFLKDRVEVYKITSPGRNLIHSRTNINIFKELGYLDHDFDNTKSWPTPWSPEYGSIGLVEKEAKSQSSGNTYTLFKEYDSASNKLTGRISVINKEALSFDDNEYQIWDKSRNSIKIGRFIRYVLGVLEYKFTDKDIENFTNKFKSSFDFTKDGSKQFDIVKGDEIAHWYKGGNYVAGGGMLNNSCMANSGSYYFDLYTKNPDKVSMVILYGDNGVILDDGKYKCSKIKGRAILWEGEMNGSTVKFMDRVYTTNDSDVDLFIKYAVSNNFWYKEEQSMYPETKLTNGTIFSSSPFIARLENLDFEYYPYVDSLCFLDENIGISNDLKWEKGGKIKMLRRTDGGFEPLLNGRQVDIDDFEHYDD